MLVVAKLPQFLNNARADAAVRQVDVERVVGAGAGSVRVLRVDTRAQMIAQSRPVWLASRRVLFDRLEETATAVGVRALLGLVAAVALDVAQRLPYRPRRRTRRRRR